MALLLPLPLLVWWLLPPYRERMAAVRFPYFEKIAEAAEQKPGPGSVVLRTNWFQKLLAPLAWVLIMTAMARPQWVENPIQKIESARDILLAMDISQSMEARDYVDSQGSRVDRLTAIKQVIDEFITRRKGDRIGLVVFGAAAYPQAPFTLDHEVCRQMLDEIGIGMAGPQTMIGDAIGLGIKLFEKSKAKEKVLILLTDGNDTGSVIPPSKAASIAKQHDIVIYTIAIGNPNTGGGEKVDLRELQSIAAATGGQFFRGEDRASLEEIYRTLDKLTPENFESLSYRPKTPLYQWPLGAAIFLLIGYHVVMTLFSIARRRLARGEEEAA